MKTAHNRLRFNVGDRFGNLTVINDVPISKECGTKGKRATWFFCRCDCGAEKWVQATSLKTGVTKSCGCLKRSSNGESRTRLYDTWIGMKARCYSKNADNYQNYGDRGIVVCEEWKNSYPNFRQWAMSHGYRDDLTLDRIDPDGNYTPNNCRWATLLTQENNRRNNVRLTLDGKTKTMSEWARELKLPYETLASRYRSGWSTEDILTKPVRPHPDSVPKNIYLTANGQTKTLSQWSKELNVDKQVLYKRIKYGWSEEDVVTRPVQHKHKRKENTEDGNNHDWFGQTR